MTGLLWTADCMEIMILSLIAPVLKCEMGLADVQIASLTTAVFAGNFSSVLNPIIPGVWSGSTGLGGGHYGPQTRLLILWLT